jgi:ATP-dependent Lon protease
MNNSKKKSQQVVREKFLIKKLKVLRRELSRSQTEAAGLREDQTKLQSSFAASERTNNVLKGKLSQLQSPRSIR